MSRDRHNVRPLRPLRVLLVSDDTRYADELVSTAQRLGTSATAVPSAADIDAAAVEYVPNVVVFDAETSVARSARRATAFAVLHPEISVGLVAKQGVERRTGNLSFFRKRGSVERLLGELERVHLGLPAPLERGESSVS